MTENRQADVGDLSGTALAAGVAKSKGGFETGFLSPCGQ